MKDCLFCKIARGEIPADIVYENEDILAFRDISPQAAKHVLIITKQHFEGLNDLDKATDTLLANLLRAAKTAAQAEGIEKSGYRLVSNCGTDAQQSVSHLHFHVIGGQELSERMA
jgi:histidine triad (HIT) family protein